MKKPSPLTTNRVPGYLSAYATLYAEDPRQANLAWFRDARFGLFVHYGLYSLLAGEWENPYVSNKGSEWIQWTAL